jgi:hypothetical protein
VAAAGIANAYEVEEWKTKTVDKNANSDAAPAATGR